MVIQGFLPIVSLSPGLIIILLAMVIDPSVELMGRDAKRIPILNYSLWEVSVVLILWDSFFDGLATILVIKAYKVALLKHFNRKTFKELLFCKNWKWQLSDNSGCRYVHAVRISSIFSLFSCLVLLLCFMQQNVYLCIMHANCKLSAEVVIILVIFGSSWMLWKERNREHIFCCSRKFIRVAIQYMDLLKKNLFPERSWRKS